MRRFDAPWTMLLKLVTGGSVLLLLFASSIALWKTPSHYHFARSLMLAVPVIVIGAGAFFMVRGYTLEGEILVIQRLGWQTRLDLTSLTDVQFNPVAIARSIRLFGNGGFFSFTGWFRNKHLGVYRLYGTDPSRAVILTFAGGRKVVVTPDDPPEFVAAVRGR